MSNVMQRFLGGLSALSITVKNLTVTGSMSNTSPGSGAESVVLGLTASTTHTIVGGTPLTAVVNQLSTVANSGDAVTLAAMSIGQHQDIYNDGAHPAGVYPSASGIAIDGGSAGAAATLTNALRCRYTQVSATLVKSAQLGAVSA